MNSCQLLIVKTPATRLLQVTTPAVLKVTTPATKLLQETPPLVLAAQTKPTLLLQSKGGPVGPPGPSAALTTVSSAVDANTAALGSFNVYRMTTPGKTLTISSADITEGRIFIVRAVDASAGEGNRITIATGGSETIDNGTEAFLTLPYASITLQATGGNLESIA